MLLVGWFSLVYYWISTTGTDTSDQLTAGGIPTLVRLARLSSLNQFRAHALDVFLCCQTVPTPVNNLVNNLTVNNFQ